MPDDPHAHPLSAEFYEGIDIEELARRQGVKPVADFRSLLGGFWPEGEPVDDFLAARREWKREGRREKSAR